MLIGGTTIINSLVTSMDPEQFQFYWMMSTAVGRKTRWPIALIVPGAYTTAITRRTCQSDVQPVRVVVQITILDFPVNELIISPIGRIIHNDRKQKR